MNPNGHLVGRLHSTLRPSQPWLTAVAASILTLAVTGGALALSETAQPKLSTPRVGIVKFDYGADGTVEDTVIVPVEGCGASTGSSPVAFATE